MFADLLMPLCVCCLPSMQARDVLSSNRFVALTSRVVDERTSADGAATKLLVELQDGLRVEAVILRWG